MSLFVRKLLLAAAISVSGILCTIAWYLYEVQKFSAGEVTKTKEVARLDDAKNEVQKRIVGEVIWQKVPKDEPLHIGEAVRTSSNAEATIRFLSGLQINLDPDSVIEIQESGDKLKLDFLKGNLFVKTDGKVDNSISLKSGETNIALNNADLALGKGAGKSVDVQVFRGTAQLSSGNKTLTLDQSKSGAVNEKGLVTAQEYFFKIKSPEPNEIVYVNTEKREPVLFSWQTLSSDYDVRIEAGTRRNGLNVLRDGISGSSGEVKVSLRAGSQFWRLVAVNRKNPNDKKESPIFKVMVVSNVPPKPMAPAADEVVSVNPSSGAVEFLWLNFSNLEKLQLEVAKTPRFQETDIVNQLVEDTGLFSAKLLEEGTYYWRITGSRKGAQFVKLSSAPRRFFLRTKFQLIPPKLETPLAAAALPFDKVNNGTFQFAWTPVPGISTYRLKVESEKGGPEPILLKDVAGSKFRLPQLPPGNYKWSVVSIDVQEKVSAISEVRKFTVDRIPELTWITPGEQEKHFYVTPKPSLNVKWNRVIGVAKYKVTMTSPNGGLPVTEFVTIPEFKITVPTDGSYQVVVEALNTQNSLVAMSSKKEVQVAPLALLPPPKFPDRMPASLDANRNGTILVNWTPVKGAKHYWLHIKNKDKPYPKRLQRSSQATIGNLYPGTYKISLSTVDAFDREGVVGEEKTIRVPETSDSKASSVKGIKFND